MFRLILFIVIGLVFLQDSTAQSIQGSIKNLQNKEIVLKGFYGLQEKEVAKTTTDSLGNFIIKYPNNYVGAAVLQTQEGKDFIVILNHENATLNWGNSNDFNTLKINNSPENELFQKGILVYQESEQKLSGLRYLVPLYNNNKPTQETLNKEISSNEVAFQNYLNQLPKDSYTKHYLNLRKLAIEIGQTTKQNPEQFSKFETAFNTINFNDQSVIHSGLLAELLGGYFSLLESNLQNPANLELVDAQVKSGLTAIVNSLAKNTILQEEVAQYLFKNFEKRNLNAAAEFLALQMLNQSNCQLSSKSTQLFEQYRKLAIGTTAPDIDLGNGKALSKIKSQYKLIVFGASTCPNCQTDYPSLIGKYNQFKAIQSLEVIYISLDTDKAAFTTYYKESPFITYCDYKGWETQAAKEYYVNATPTYILVDKDLKIIMKLKSPQDLEELLINANKK